MRTLTREQLLGAGLLSGLMAFVGMSYGADQPSVAHAALNVVNNRASIAREFGQTIPDPTETPTPEIPLLIPTATSDESAATPTPNGPTATPDHAQDTYSQLNVVVFDSANQTMAEEPIRVKKEFPIQDEEIATDLVGNLTQTFLDGQTASLSTEGPNGILRAEYAFHTNNQLFNQVSLSHESGDDLASSLVVSTTHQSQLQAEAAEVLDDPTATPAPTSTPAETATPAPTGEQPTPDVTPTPVVSPTPDQSNPTPLPINLEIAGVVLTDTIGLDSSPDGTHVEVTDFETSGSVSLSSGELVGAAAIDSPARANYDITVAASGADPDGFNLSVGFADGSMATGFVSPEAFSTGSLVMNTLDVGSAIANSPDGTIDIQVAIDTNGDGLSDATAHIPAEVQKPGEQKNKVYVPFVQR